MIPVIIAMAAAQALNCSGNQMQLDACADRIYRRADAAMNLQWKATLAYMHGEDADMRASPEPRNGPSYADALLASQRAWLQFRDAECVVEGYAVRGGTLEPMVVSECLAALTTERTKQLKAMTEAE